MEDDLALRFGTLQMTLKKIEESLEWLKLQEFEKAGASSNAFRPFDRTRSGLVMLCTVFRQQYTAMQVLLNGTGYQTRNRWTGPLKTLWSRFRTNEAFVRGPGN